MKNIRILLAALVFGAASLQADGPQTPLKGSAELERLKTLVGRWEGTTTMGNKPEKATVDYAITSNGSAVMETLGKGTSHEMVSIYHDRNGKLSMTHYCAMGNQPRLDLAKADASSLELVLGKDTGIDPVKDSHMHSLTLATPDKDHLTHTWTHWENGKEKDRTTFTLTRAK